MNQWEMVGKAVEVSVQAHQGQMDKSGMPYILHPLRVMATFKDPYLMAIAVLHDVVEDTSVTIDNLRSAGFPERVVEGVEAMTYKKDESRDQYYGRVKRNHDAREVKIHDIFDNLSPDRMGLLTQADRIRLTTKYGHALESIYSID
jgi:(p)ppGpp synthase/HD superfamily hydrolase